jgi:hypothetical protein
MRNFTVFTVAVTLLAGGVVLCQTSAQDSQSKGTMALRGAVLSREAFKGSAPAVPGTIRAVVYDWDVGGGVATLVAFHDGTTSIYLSSGGGFVGAGAHDSVKRAAAAFRDEAARMRRHFTPAETFPLPDRGRSRFYIVTDGATLQSALFSDSEVQEEGHPLNKLARQAQDVMTAVRRVSK